MRFVMRGGPYVASCAAVAVVGLACSGDPHEASSASASGSDDSGASSSASTTTDGSGESGTPEQPSGPWDEGWPIPAEPQTPGDPELGWYHLVHTGYITCGIPTSIWALARPFLGDAASDETLPDRVGINADMPYNWTVHTPASGVEIASQNCLQCHAGHFDGELVVGLGNAEFDFTVPMSERVGAIPVDEGSPGDLGEFGKFLDRLEALGPTTAMRTVGTNPAEMIAITLVSHRDRHTLEWSDEALYDLPQQGIPSDVPPWWRAKKKNALFYNAMARGDHRGTMMLATSLCTDSVPEAEQVVSHFADIQAFIRSIEAPKYPFAIDAELAAEGKPVFEANCGPCHGTYGETDDVETYPNLLLPLEVVGTDPVVAEGGTLWAPFLVEWYNESFYGSVTRMEPDDPFPGYVAPPLDGVWASGPFLHNGSVPTIELVLDSTRRPTYWRRLDYDSTHFDQYALGWPFEALDHGQDQAAPEDAKYIYDTTLFGHASGGHNFGDHLTDAERRAVLEYLKTL
jgi:mono/diheme cytochrome c family protein